MQVNGIGNVHGAQNIQPSNAARPAEQASQTEAISTNDEISISQEADLLSRIHEMPDVRQDVVDQIRAEIANGTYETGDKLDIAASRLLDEMA